MLLGDPAATAFSLCLRQQVEAGTLTAAALTTHLVKFASDMGVYMHQLFTQSVAAQYKQRADAAIAAAARAGLPPPDAAIASAPLPAYDMTYTQAMARVTANSHHLVRLRGSLPAEQMAALERRLGEMSAAAQQARMAAMTAAAAAAAAGGGAAGAAAPMRP